MSRSAWVMAVLVSAAVQARAPSHDRGGNVLEELTRAESHRSAVPVSADAADASPLCTADRVWCASIEADRTTGEVLLRVFDGRYRSDDHDIGRHALPLGKASGASEITLWPRMVRLGAAAWSVVAQGEALDSAVLIGVQARISEGYSGGSASATDLTLFLATRSEEGPQLRDVLKVTVGGGSMIRACFSEEDLVQRAGACHDEYTFEGTLTLDPRGEGMPLFGYQTTATSFPGPVSRSEDSLQNPPLDESDLVTVVDEACSYRRTFVHDPVSGTYRPDSPLPACDDYTVP